MTLDTAARTIHVAFADPATSAAGTQTYHLLRLRCDKVSRPEARRPGNGFRVSEPATGVSKSRGAFEIPAATQGVTIAYDEQ